VSETDRDLTLTALKRAVADYHRRFMQPPPFVPGETPVPVSGKVFDHEELQLLVEASLDGWWTEGRFTQQAGAQLADFLGTRDVMLCNSGSSANLLALTAFTSRLFGERRLRPGDEVIGVAAGFPTTIAPTIQTGCVPVLLDIELETYNVDVARLEEAVSPRTRAIMLAHTLGNPWNVEAVTAVARKHDLWLIEDCCDALGATWRDEMVGSFGDVATLSFYPAHQMTCGEGGAVFSRNTRVKRTVESFRDWGRDCYCSPGKENTCGKRFGWQLGDLPSGYDHKYIYSHIGYNLKTTDLQGALLIAQLKKLPGFIAARRRNWARLRAAFERYEEWLILPRGTAGSDPSWFGFVITVREGAPFTRAELVAHLESRKIATRMLFAGNMARQPAFEGVEHRVGGELANTDRVMRDTFWIGVWPGLSDAMLDWVEQSVADFMQARRSGPIRHGSFGDRNKRRLVRFRPE
jgi:CDP-6-deoxy-D-xylo-4-hexulose-3-dehydrase